MTRRALLCLLVGAPALNKKPARRVDPRRRLEKITRFGLAYGMSPERLQMVYATACARGGEAWR